MLMVGAGREGKRSISLFFSSLAHIMFPPNKRSLTTLRQNLNDEIV